MNLKRILLRVVYIKKANDVFVLMFIGTIYYVFLFQYPYSYNYLIEINKHFHIFSIVLICFSAFVIFQIAQSKVIFYHLIDLLFTILLVCSFLCIAFSSSLLNLNNEYFVCSVIMLMIYLVIRTSRLNLEVLLPVLISVFFFIELCIGIKQFFINKNNSQLYLNVQGSLNNSGIYSVFLVANLPILSYTLNLTHAIKKVRNYFIIIIHSLIVLILIVTQSRTAIIMFIVLWLYHLFLENPRNKWAVFKKHKKKFIILLFIIFSTCVILASVSMKQASSFGRLLIWQISLKHIPDSFFSGVGVGNFPLYYPKWQIQYFASHPNPITSYFLNAGETRVAFNEYLQFFTETGIIGFLFFATILFLVFSIKSESDKSFILSAKAVIAIILVSCALSYPLHCNPILFLLFLCVAVLCIKSTKKLQFNFKSHFKIFILIPLLLLLVSVIFKSTKQNQAIAKWELVRENFFLDSLQIKNEYEALYPLLNTNGKFLLDFGERLTSINEFKEGAEILETSKSFYISYRTFISTANTYYKSHNIPQAIRNLEQATNLIPSKFYPKYELAKLYFLCGDTVKGKKISNLILTMPVKKMSPDVIAIKNEMLEMQFHKEK